MIWHNAISIHGDILEIIGEMMDHIGYYLAQGAPFHVGTSREAGSEPGIADYLAEGLYAIRFFQDYMVIAGSVVIVIALAAGIGMGEIGLIGRHGGFFRAYALTQFQIREGGATERRGIAGEERNRLGGEDRLGWRGLAGEERREISAGRRGWAGKRGKGGEERNLGGEERNRREEIWDCGRASASP